MFVLAGAVFLAAGVGNVRGQSCGFDYQFGSNGPVYPGGTFSIYNTFANTGSVDIQITSIELRFDFATYDAPSSELPLQVSAGSSRTLYFDIQIPSDAFVGDHGLTTLIGLQCYAYGGWVTPSESPAIVSSTQMIGQNPAASASIAQGFYGATITGAVAVAGIIVWIMWKRMRTPPPPEPSQMPFLPPSEPPIG